MQQKFLVTVLSEARILNKLPVFKCMPKYFLYVICRLCEQVEFKDGERIFDINDATDYVYFIQSGEVLLTKEREKQAGLHLNTE